MQNLKTINITKTCFIIMIICIFLRILFYSYHRPFWNDECALALNIMDFNFLNCFKPLNYGQAAPPLFLIISGLFSKIIPNVEFSLRFFPLISSILSIFVFYNLSKNILSKKSAVWFALILFCFNYKLLYFSQEFKQYSTDILVFLGILTSYFYLKIKDKSAKNLIATGVIYAISIWLSYASLFALFTLGSVLFLKNYKDYKKIIILFLPVIFSFMCFYFAQHHLTSSNYLHAYWREGFINNNFNNFVPLILNYFSYSLNSIFIFLFFIIGVLLKLFDIKNEKSLMILMPIFLAIFLSYFSIYPLESRASLYLIPICILFTAQIIDYINLKNKTVNNALCGVIILFVSFPIIINSLYKIIFKNFDMEDIVTPLSMASKMIKNEDILYIPDGSEISYNVYKRKFNFKNVIIEKQRVNNTDEYLSILNKLNSNKTYYYVFCHFPNKQERLKDIYLWAKNKKNFKIYADRYSNALIIFTK